MTRVLLLTILMLGPAAEAQILPRVPLPTLPGGLPGTLTGNLPTGAGLPGGLTQDGRRLERARKLRIRLLLRRHADVVEADPSGEPIVRGEVVALSPTDGALAQARSAGFSIVRDGSLGALGIRIVVLGVPPGTATSQALSALRRLDPAGTYDFNNIYTESGMTGGAGTMPAGPGGPGSESPAATPLGLVDGGVGTVQTVFG